MRLRNLCTGTLLTLLLAACGQPVLSVPKVTPAEVDKERERQYQYYLDMARGTKAYRNEARMQDVAFAILSAAAPYCLKERNDDYGLVLLDPQHFEGMKKSDINDYTLLAEGIGVLFVAKNSSAAAAGIAPADVISAIQGVPLASASIREARKVYLEALRKGGALQLTVNRQGAAREVTLSGIPSCHYEARVIESREINAFADGENIYLTTAMLNFTKTDQELALVVAHEVSHNLLRHQSKTKSNIILGALADIALQAGTGVNSGGEFTDVGARIYSQAFESEADYLGLYLMQNAGYSISGAEDFWRRMAAKDPESIAARFSATHPSTPERFLTIEKTVQEITAKQSSGQPVVPTSLNRS